MKSVYTCFAVLLTLAVGWLFWQHWRPAPEIALLDVEKVIAESAPGKASRAHLDKLDLHFRQGLQQLHHDYQQAPPGEQQRMMANAEQMLGQQFGRTERTISDALKGIILEEAEKWRQKHGIHLVLPAQLALASATDADATTEVLQAVNQREMRFPRLPALDFLQPGELRPPQPGQTVPLPPEKPRHPAP